MNHASCIPGTLVFWPGAVWAAGTCTAFVRSGTILSEKGGQCKIEETQTGKRFTKHRCALYLTAAKAEKRMHALTARERRVMPPRPGCNKTGYPDKRAAVTALRRAEKRRVKPGTLRAYQCDRCPCWHLTREPLAEFRERQTTEPA